MRGRNLYSAIICGAIAALGLLEFVPAHAADTVADLKNLYGAELEVLGDVQHVDLAKGTLVVAGQNIEISKDTVFSLGSRAAADSASALHTIQNGEMVAISGPLKGPAVSVTRWGEASIAGASTIFVRGEV